MIACAEAMSGWDGVLNLGVLAIIALCVLLGFFGSRT